MKVHATACLRIFHVKVAGPIKVLSCHQELLASPWHKVLFYQLMSRFRYFSKDIFSVVLVSVFLLLYCILLHFENTLTIALGMLMLSPFLVIWMVLTVLVDGKYEGPELGEEEFGYLDKKKEDLGTFW